MLVLSIGPPFKYVIPSFDVLAVSMRPARIRVKFGRQDKAYDIFIRTDNSLNEHLLPAMLKVKDYALVQVWHEIYCIVQSIIHFFSQESEFCLSVDLSNFNIPPQGVLVAWLWDWQEECENETHTDVESREQFNPYLLSESDSDKSDNEATQANLPLPREHTVTFKCVGSTHDPSAQECLSKVSKLLREDKSVEVKIVPEPNNQYMMQEQLHFNAMLITSGKE